MKLKVHLFEKHDPELINPLREYLKPDIAITCSEVLPTPADYDILISGVPDKESIEASPNLKILIIPWSGLPRKTRQLMRSYPDIAIHNIHHNAVPVAEMAITLMLAAAKDLIPIDQSFRKNDWSKRYDPPSLALLLGGRAVILGFGSIGRAIASRCLGFGMEVKAIDANADKAGGRTAKTPGEGARDRNSEAPDIPVSPPDELQILLPGAQVLFISVPLTDSTKGLLGTRELSLLPDGAIVVNISRGRIIDEEALFAELKTGRIRAGIDVWYNYPESEQSRAGTSPSALPFCDLPNVVMTPHLAGHSNRTELLRARELARLLNLALEGRPLPNQVGVERGY
jgi:phosphoglycerate dehydrogenase-like enzyme